jgi:hypothetical protein
MVIITPVSLSKKVIALSVCVIGLILMSGCTSPAEKEGIAGKYFITNSSSASYMQISPDGTCYLFDHMSEKGPLGFNCTFTTQSNAIKVCYPTYSDVCDTWTIVSSYEISSPAGLRAKKVR